MSYTKSQIKQRFMQSVKCGTGEAYFILKANPNIDFFKHIEKAILTNFAYDAQCERDRAVYVSRLIDLSKRKDELVEIAIKALKNERKDSRNLDHLFELAAIYAKDGNIKAKRAIYKNFNKIADNFLSRGVYTLLKIDGIDGLKHIAEIIGKALVKNPEELEDSYLVDYFQKENPKIKVYEELRKAAKDNPFIDKYLKMINKHKWTKPKRPKRPRLNFKFVKDRIESTSRFPVPPGVARKLSKTDVKKLADDFLQEKDLLKREKYLSLFSDVKYPYGHHDILQIAMGKNIRNSRQVERACEALVFFKAKDIRQFAISKLSKTNIPSDYLPLLVANYKKGDCKLLTKIASKYNNEDVIHDFVWAYIDIYKANKTRECKKPLEVIYSKLTCGLHRYDIVEILHDNGVLSKKIFKELEFDSLDEIRDFYKKISK